MQDKLRPAFYEQTMERIESIRMGLWFMFIQRSQGHMAHAILEEGFKVIQFLNRLVVSLDHFNEAEWRIWAVTRDGFRKPLEESHKFLLGIKANARMVQKVWSLNVELLGLAPMAGRFFSSSTPTQEQQERQAKQEGEPCTSALSQSAENQSTKGSLFAENTGNVSQSETGASSTDYGTCSDRETSSQTTTSTPSEQSLPGTGYKKGTGHPRRGNPYTSKKNTPR